MSEQQHQRTEAALALETIKRVTGAVTITITPSVEHPIEGRVDLVTLDGYQVEVTFDQVDDAIAMLESIREYLPKWWARRQKTEMF